MFTTQSQISFCHPIVDPLTLFYVPPRPFLVTTLPSPGSVSFPSFVLLASSLPSVGCLTHKWNHVVPDFFHLTSIHPCRRQRQYLTFACGWACSTVYMRLFFISSPMKGHVGCLPVLATGNHVAVNIGVPTSLRINISHFGVHT